MITGLEFLKSWRFWVVLTASTSAITLGTAGVYIASVQYLTLVGGEPDPLYIFLAIYLAGFALCFLAGAVLWLYYRRDESDRHYPEKHRTRLFLGSIGATSIVVLFENTAVHWLIVQQIVQDQPVGGFYYIGAILFGIGFGPLIASREWAAMLDTDDDPDRAATPGPL